MLFLLFVYFQEVSEVRLETSGAYLFTTRGISRARVLDDGSYLVWEEFAFYHFNKDGTLKFKRGRQGKAPGEFNYVLAATQYQNHFLILDGRTSAINVFDMNGEYLRRNVIMAFSLENVNGVLVGADYAAYQRNISSGYQLETEFFQVYSLNESRRVLAKGVSFLKPDDVCIGWKYESCSYYLTEVKGQVFVVGSLCPKLLVFKPGEFTLLDERDFDIEGYTPPPSVVPYERSTLELLYNARKKFTRIAGLTHFKDELVLTYVQACQSECEIGQKYIQKFSLEGKPTSKAIPISGFLMGTFEDKVKIFEQRKLENGDYEQVVKSFVFND